MKTFYFTASGNSLEVARAIGGELISIPQALAQDDLIHEADKIGIVCPVYGFTVPHIVSEFIDKATLKSSYIFLVATYGNATGDVCGWTERYMAKRGMTLNYASSVLMIDNYLPRYDLDEQLKMEKNTEGDLERVISDISAGRKSIDRAGVGMRLATDLMRFGDDHTNFFNQPTSFQVNDDCTSCGVCTRVCPRANVSLAGRTSHPEFGSQCEYCLACVHNCPSAAIKIKGEKNPDMRWRHPNVKVADIVKANGQENAVSPR